MLYADKTRGKSRRNLRRKPNGKTLWQKTFWKILFCAVLTVAAEYGRAQTVAESPRLRMETGGHIGAVHSLLFAPLAPADPQHQRLISCGADKVVRVHALAQDDAAAWRYQIGDGFSGQFFAAALNPAHSNQLALGSSGKDTKSDSDILLTDFVTGSQTGRLTLHKGTITGLAYSPDGGLLASCGTDGKVALWNLDSAAKNTAKNNSGKNNSGKTAPNPPARALGKPAPRILLDDGDYMTGVAFAADGKWLAATGWRVDDEDEHRGIVRIWQLDAQHSPRPLHTFTWGSGISCVAWAPPSRRYPQGLLAYGSEEGVIQLRDPAQNFAEHSLLTIQNDSITCLACNRAGTRLLSGSGSKGHDVAARVWSLEDDTQIKAFERHITTVLSVAFSPDGDTAASGDAFGMVYLWSAKNGEIKNGEAQNGQAQNEPEVRAFEEIRAFKGPGNPVFKVAWSSDGSRVAWGNTFGRETLEHAFAMETGAPDPKFAEARYRQKYTWRRAQHTWTAAASHPQGKSGDSPSFVLTAMPDDSGVIIRNHKGQEIRRIKLGVTDRLRCYSFTPDGKVVVGSDLDLAVYTLSGKFARRKVRFEGHEGPVLDLAVDPTGRYLASGGLDQTVRLWDLKAAERASTATPEDVGAAHTDSPGLLPHQDALPRWGDPPGVITRSLDSLPAISPLLGLFAGDGGVWAAWAQNGCYAASPAGEDVIGWHINQGADKPAEFRTAYQCPQFYQPGVIALVAKTGDLNRALAAVFPDHPPSFLDMPRRIVRVPKLASVTLEANGQELKPRPDGVYHSDTPHVRLHCRFETSGPDLTVEAALNNTNSKPFTFLDRKSVDLEAYDRQGAERTLNVPDLQSGQNTIRIFAQNNSGISDDSVRVVCDDAALPPQTLRVLAVGISRYNAPGLKLKYADKDAQDILDFFKANFQANSQAGGKKLFDDVETVPLLDQDATRRNIQTKLEELLNEVKPQDTVLLYFSCHGFAADGKDGTATYYLAPADIAIEKSNRGRNTVQNGYAWKDILNRLTGVQARHIILMIDHCFAGGVSNTLERENERFQEQTETLREMRRNNILVFTASASTEYSYEDDDLQHGVFTATILDALKGRMDPILYPDGYAMLNALDFWVPLQMARLNNGKFKAQHPFLFALPDANKAVPLANVPMDKPTANP